MQKEIVLPADVYDTLELAALANGGVGRGLWWRERNNMTYDPNCPICINGLAVFAGVVDGPDLLATPWNAVGIDVPNNDAAVFAINDRLGRDSNARVGFAEYVKELNIVRGD